ncbi:MAG: alpha/beta hydrolase [Rubrivivax sp.]|jgi:pimeloyl-ACP methyl ester carboxylesterase
METPNVRESPEAKSTVTQVTETSGMLIGYFVNMSRISLHVESGGDEVQLRVQCSGQGVPTLFLHGFPDDADHWSDLVAALQDRLRCWCPDLRGYRHSTKPAALEAYRVERLLGDVDALVTALLAEADQSSTRFDAVNLVGHDWGGMLAWIYAGLRPERVRRLAVLNAPHPVRLAEVWRDDAAQRQASSYMKRLAHPQAADRLAADDHALLRQLVTAESPGLTPAQLQRLLDGWRTPGALPAMCRWYAALELAPSTAGPATTPLDALAALCRPVTMPVCVVWGDRDGAFVPAVLEGLELWAPLLQVHRIAQAGHWVLRSELSVRQQALNVLSHFLAPPP